MHRCRRCGAVLGDDNWAPAIQAQGCFICDNCRLRRRIAKRRSKRLVVPCRWFTPNPRTRSLPRDQRAFVRVWHQYREGAFGRGLVWRLTWREFVRLIRQPCYYCGAPPKQLVRYGGVRYLRNGLDRVDNTRGYLPDNVVPCCTQCNYAKRKRSLREFLRWARNVYLVAIRGRRLYPQNFSP